MSGRDLAAAGARLESGIGLSVLFLAQWLIISLAFREVAEDYLASRLEADTEALLAAAQFDAGGQLRLDPARVDPAFQRVFSGRYFAIVADGPATLRSRSLWDTDMPLPRQEVGAGSSACARRARRISSCS